MITFFPIPYPGEIFYGVVSRYKVWNGLLDNKNLLRDLYGKTTITAGRVLPANFELLLSNLPSNYCKTLEELIYEHTGFRFYTAFATEEVAEKVYTNMKADRGSNVYNTLGLSNNTIKCNSLIKYCSQCAEEERKIHKNGYGEAYIHLEHQLDGVLICSKHNKVLNILSKSIDKINRQDWLNLEMDIDINEDKDIAVLDDRAILMQKVYCNNVNKLLKLSSHQHKEMNYFRELYVKKLIEKGISDNRMKLNQDDILRAFKGFFGEEYLNVLGANFDTNEKHNWVTKICRKHRNIFHPLQHLLMIQFLDIEINDLFLNKNSGLIQENHMEKSSEEIQDKRTKWINLMELYKEETTTYLRKHDRATYAWLRKYDNEWLKNNLPKRKSRGNGNNHIIDWEKRDEEILEASKIAIKEILDLKCKPERVTISLIGRKIGKQYILSKKIDKLEKTKQFLESNIETVEQFQKRRLEWARSKYPEMREWELKQIVGIR